MLRFRTLKTHLSSQATKPRLTTSGFGVRSRQGSIKMIAALSAAATALVAFAAVFTWILVGGGLKPSEELDVAIGLLESNQWQLAQQIVDRVDTGADTGVDTGEPPVEVPELEPVEAPPDEPPTEPVAEGDVPEIAQSSSQSLRSKITYIRGVVIAQRENGELHDPLRRAHLWDAVDLLKQSEKLGFPIGQRGEAMFYMGRCYYHMNQPNKAITCLLVALDEFPKRRFEIKEMLSRAYCQVLPPDYRSADEILDRWDNFRGINSDLKDKGKVLRAEVRLHQKKPDQAIELLMPIQPASKAYQDSRFVLGRAHLQKFQAQKSSRSPIPVIGSSSQDAQTQHDGVVALEYFRQVMLAPETDQDLRRESNMWAGITQRILGRYEESLSTLSGVRQRSPRTAEAITAGLEEAEMQLENHKYSDVLNTIRIVTQDASDMKLYDPKWVSEAELRSRLLAIGQKLRVLDRFEDSIVLSKLLPPIFPMSDSVRMQADAYRNLAETTMQQAKTQLEGSGRELVERANQLYQKAGDHYIQLAELESVSTEYPILLWEAVINYQKGGDLQKSNQTLEKYILHENRERRPRALLVLAENELALGDLTRATEALDRALMDYSDHPIAYEARLILSKVYQEQGEFEDAADLLISNLYDGSLTPASEVWQNSIYGLGEVLFRTGDTLRLETMLASGQNPKLTDAQLSELKKSQARFTEAISKLREATARFESDPRSIPAYYYVAEGYRQASEWPKVSMSSGNIAIESNLRALIQQRRELLESALQAYRTLKSQLNASDSQQANQNVNKSMLRNSYFGEADCLFELGLYTEAIEAYRGTLNRFLNEPESLEALAQITRCYRELGKPEEAQRYLLQAEQVLSRIPADRDASFLKLTRYDREGWKQLIEWLKTW